MFNAFMTEDMRQEVRDAVAANPNVMLDRLSADLGIPEAAVAGLLDDDMCRSLPAAAFERIWETMTQWEKVTFVVATPAAIIEVKGPLPRGTFGHGFFNIGENRHPLGGHIRVDDLGIICLVSKPFMGLESHSVRFYSKTGGCVFAVYVGRSKAALIPSVREGFMRLRELAKAEEVRA